MNRRSNRRPLVGDARGSVERPLRARAEPDPGAAQRQLDEGADSASGAALDGLGVGGFTRRRAAFLVGTFVTLWIVAVFAHQVGDASAASAQADAMRASNAALAAEVDGLRDELGRIQDAPYVVQQARGFDLGAPNERPFELAAGAPPLPSNAPGSAAQRLGAREVVRSPLETWLSLLFGSDRRS